jgi:Ferredoxin subunits of nitrite reductase and ring-hydroxylating dioxygenases
MPFYALEKQSALQEGYFKPCSVAGLKLLLICSEGKTYIVGQTCPHGGASLKKGKVAGDSIRCPKHGIGFDLFSGAPRGGAAVADIQCLNVYQVVVSGEHVGIEL